MGILVENTNYSGSKFILLWRLLQIPQSWYEEVTWCDVTWYYVTSRGALWRHVVSFIMIYRDLTEDIQNEGIKSAV